MIRSTRLMPLTLVAFAAILAWTPAAASERFGWAEWAAVADGDIRLRAKLDTGALASSLHVTNLTEFRRNGDQWVRFTIVDRRGRSYRLERPVVRQVGIRRAGGKFALRPSVMLDICVGSARRATEVTLADRSGQFYPLLLGRGFLTGVAIVSSGDRFLRGPRCSAAARAD